MLAKRLRSPLTGNSYSHFEPLGKGGFGQAYRARLKKPGSPPSLVCVKLTDHMDSWITEVQFGRLLRGKSRIIELYDYFAVMQPNGRQKYALVMELAAGTVEDYMTKHGNFARRKAVTEVTALLKVLSALHSISVVHRDLTPMNVLVTMDGRLKLADFGIARTLLPGEPVLASMLNPWFVDRGHKGSPSDDVYLMGQLLAKMLTGQQEPRIKWSTVRRDPRVSAVLSVLERSIGPKSRRFTDATEMLVAIVGEERSPYGGVTSLNRKCVVFTGGLTIRREDAALLVLQSGGRVHTAVGGGTNVIVVGSKSPHYNWDFKGRKLKEAQRRIAAGQKIRIIGESEFLRLVRMQRSR